MRTCINAVISNKKDKIMKNFEGLGLHPVLVKSLAHMKYDTPTPIQAQGIPLALKGRDVMGSAQTGTGKTAAFAIPMIQKLLSSPNGNGIILTPTRELAKQIMEVVHQMLGHKSNINTAFLIGGEPMGKQFSQLKRNPRIVVGTPGRINDHLNRKSLNLNQTDFLVLDETDRMLDMGFSIQIDEIVKHLPKKRQTLMFSATLPQNIIKLSQNYLNNPERISVGSTVSPIKNIRQEVIRVNNEEKYDVLVRELHARSGSVIIFVKTKFGTEKLAKRLNQEDLDAQAIHGDLRQRRRDRVIQDLRNKKFRILVATDVIARGLDIPHIEHVINYDLPQVPEDYIHRIGRTARAGASGDALCLISPQDGRKWYAIEMLMNPNKKPEFKTDRKPNKFKSRGGSGRKPGRSFGDKSQNNFGGGYKGKSENRSWKKQDGKSEERSDRKPWGKSEGGKSEVNSKSGYKGKSEGGYKGKSGNNKPWKKTGERSEGGYKGKPKNSSWKKSEGGHSEGNSDKKPWKRTERSTAGKPNHQSSEGRKFDRNSGDQARKRTEGNSAEYSSNRPKGKKDTSPYVRGKSSGANHKPRFKGNKKNRAAA